MIKDFITLEQFNTNQLENLIKRTIADKKLYLSGKGPAPLTRQTLAMIFEKPSLRTRVSFEVAMTQLGGAATYLDQTSIGLGTRESASDTARVLTKMCNGIMARTFSHEMVEDLAKYSDVPVINGLTDYSHPCQAMADMVTIHEHFGKLEGKTLTFVGDGNNVARSLATACAKLGMRFVLSCPHDYQLEEKFFEDLLDKHPDADSIVLHEPGLAVKEADIIYTDTWVSMHQEDEKAKRLHIFRSYQVNSQLLALAPKHAIVLHCLPAYRGYEIIDEAFDANAEHIFNEAENRLHFQRTLLNVLMGEGGIE